MLPLQTLLSFTALFALAAPAAGLPQLAERATAFPEWRPPGAGDVRSPCPALNSLANHGFLPRNGKSISLLTLTSALKRGLNVGADFAVAIGTVGLTTAPVLNLGLTFNLNNLNKHGVIEHDASLSRVDFHLGNNSAFNKTVYDSFLASALADSPGATTMSFSSAAAGRYAQVVSSRANNPSFIYTPKELVLSYGETALYLSVLGSPLTGTPLLKYLTPFFTLERLPYLEGWTAPTIETNLATLGAMIARLQLASPPAAILEEGAILAGSSVQSLLDGGELTPLIPCALGGSGCVGV